MKVKVIRQRFFIGVACVSDDTWCWFPVDDFNDKQQGQLCKMCDYYSLENGRFRMYKHE